MVVFARMAVHVSLSFHFTFAFPHLGFIVTKWVGLYVLQALVSRGVAKGTLPCRFLPWTYVLMISIFPLPQQFSRQSELKVGK